MSDELVTPPPLGRVPYLPTHCHDAATPCPEFCPAWQWTNYVIYHGDPFEELRELKRKMGYPPIEPRPGKTIREELQELTDELNALEDQAIEMNRKALVVMEERATGVNWATELLNRDAVQGVATLQRLIVWYAEHDGKADDFGELFIVKDARAALAARGIEEL